MSSPLSITERRGIGNENARKTAGFCPFVLGWPLFTVAAMGRLPSRLIELSYKYGTGCVQFPYAP
jgi:hypothetical protein